jgi:RHS repeat-associated protein
MVYDGKGWITNLITPYGTNTFAYVGGTDTAVANDNSVSRAVLVSEPNGGRQMFLFRGLSSQLNTNAGSPALLPDSYAASQIPTNTPLGTLDTNGLTYRDSFRWDQHQFANLSSNFLNTLDCSNLTTNDYLKGRLTHWLYNGADGTVSDTASMAREASPDGYGEGPKTWFDYAGKPAGSYQGTNSPPGVLAQVLPDQSTTYAYNQLNNWRNPLSQTSTYTTGGGVSTRATTTTYAANNIDPIRVSGPDGAVLASYAVDTNFHLVTAITNPVGVTQYLYDSAKRLTGIIKPTGLLTTNFYYSTSTDSNRLQMTVVYGSLGGAALSTNSYTYTNGLIYTHTDERGLATTSTWDALGRLTGTAYPDGTYISNVYARLDLAASRDRLGHWTYYGYDNLGRQTAVTNVLNQVTWTTYCGCGAPESISNAVGITTMVYYNADRLVTKIDTANNPISYTYNAAGQLFSTTDALSHSITNWYNNQGLLCAVSNAFGQVQQTLYDAYDRPTSVADTNGVTVATAYDALGRVTVRTYPTGGGSEQYGYTTNVAAATTYTNQLGYVTAYAYDSLGRETNEVAGSGTTDAVINSFTYNGAGDRLSLRDGRGNTTSWLYDSYGRVTSKHDANNTEILRYLYDANGRLTNRWSVAKGNTAYGYDFLGNRTSVTYPVSPNLSFGYDTANRLTNMVDGVGTSAYGYDAMGLLSFEDGPWASARVSYNNLANGLRGGLSVDAPNAPAWAQSYGYDAANRMSSLVSPAGTFGYTYTSASAGSAGGLIRKIALPTGGWITNTFDGLGRETGTWLKNSSGSTMNSHQYVYNNGSQRIQTTRTAGDYVNYTYDAVGQLKTGSGQESGGSTRLLEQFGYAYDRAGNLGYRTNNALVQTFNTDNLNQLTTNSRSGTLTVSGAAAGTATNVTVNGQTATRYGDNTFALAGVSLADGTNTFTAVAQDSYGRGATNTATAYLPATMSFQYDANGNLTSDGQRAFDYDDENQLIRVIVTNAWKSEFVYDGQSRRRIRREYAWQNAAWTQTNEVRYVYDGMLAVQKRDANNLPLVTYTRGSDLSGTFQGAGGIGGLLARTANSQLLTSDSSAHCYYHSDANGNVTFLIDGHQAMAARYLYDPYGNTLSLSGPLADANTMRFSSKEWQENSGLYYYGYRFYDPGSQRWLSRDPLTESGGPHPYAFVGNSPMNNTDALGLLIYGGPSAYQRALAKSQCIYNCGRQLTTDLAVCGVVYVGGLVITGAVCYFNPPLCSTAASYSVRAVYGCAAFAGSRYTVCMGYCATILIYSVF